MEGIFCARNPESISHFVRFLFFGLVVIHNALTLGFVIWMQRKQRTQRYRGMVTARMDTNTKHKQKWVSRRLDDPPLSGEEPCVCFELEILNLYTN